MPNIKSAKKRVKVAERNRVRNRVWKSRVRTEQTKVEEALKAGDLSTCDEQVKTYYEVIDKAINKGVLHKNAGARKKARLVKRINKQKAES
ncbi:MAG: 30S ribosomal protein S20 [Cyanobacteriota/Melainabacteria group bacterium]|nr:30S ribosomal protein S20 [Cyanobacteria bacterium HKST-UBA01]MCB9468294.1 30S ribosomal protein S20 [Candidatus Obscuribacterales bacterium]